VLYGLSLPLSRNPLLVTSISPLFFAILFLIAIFVQGPAIYALTTIAIVGEYVLKASGILIIKWTELRQSSPTISRANTRTSLGLSEKSVIIVDSEQQTDLEKARKKYRIPAINIEHHVERLNAFVTIVIGEMVANIFFRTALASGLNA
jgi:low temperature requirement protein LtrA